MIKEQIAENNLLIATFMGWSHDDKFENKLFENQVCIPVWTNPESKNAILSCDFNYHKDWNLLMSVVEKIGNVRIIESKWFTVEINNGYTRIHGASERIMYNSFIEKSMIKSTYLAVIDFINWYNKQK